LNVLQSRLRNRCSALNSDLYRANLIPNALCSCGKSDETAKHFLLHCKNYIIQRNIFLIGKVGTSRIFKSRVFQVLIVGGKNEFWYDDSLFAG
jgi:hypothetical protein